jgi:hypothetical protein
MLLHILFWLMSALVFYFASRSLSKFKLVWIQIDLYFYINIWNGKAFLFSSLSWAETQPHPEPAQPAFLFSFSPRIPAIGPAPAQPANTPP